MNRNPYLSRRFILAVLNAVLVVVNEILGANGKASLDIESILAISATIITYILGESAVDAKRAGR